MQPNPFPLDWCKITEADISEQVKCKLFRLWGFDPPPLNSRHRNVREIHFSFWVISLSAGTFTPWIFSHVKTQNLSLKWRLCTLNDHSYFSVEGGCVSWRLRGNGQNRAVWWKASDRKCHFHLSTAAAKPGLAHCPSRHFAFSSPATQMDVKIILTSDRNLASVLLLPPPSFWFLECLSSFKKINK